MQTQLSPNYRPLDTKSVIAYVQSRRESRDVFHDQEAIEAVEVGDGNLNLVFKVWAKADPTRTVVLKQALPYLRLVGDSWPLPTDRARIEDVTDRSVAASLALNMAQVLIKQRRQFRRIQDVVEAATSCRPSYPWKS